MGRHTSKAKKLRHLLSSSLLRLLCKKKPTKADAKTREDRLSRTNNDDLFTLHTVYEEESEREEQEDAVEEKGDRPDANGGPAAARDVLRWGVVKPKACRSLARARGKAAAKTARQVSRNGEEEGKDTVEEKGDKPDANGVRAAAREVLRWGVVKLKACRSLARARRKAATKTARQVSRNREEEGKELWRKRILMGKRCSGDRTRMIK